MKRWACGGTEEHPTGGDQPENEDSAEELFGDHDGGAETETGNVDQVIVGTPG